MTTRAAEELLTSEQKKLEEHLFIEMREIGVWLLCIEKIHHTEDSARAAHKEWSGYYLMGGSDRYAVERPCTGCGKPLLLENAWMEDGCPCNTVAGVNNRNLYRWRLLHDLQQKQSHELSQAKRAIPSADNSELVRELRIISDSLRNILNSPAMASFVDEAATALERMSGLSGGGGVMDSTAELMQGYLLAESVINRMSTLATEWQAKQITDERFAKRIYEELQSHDETCRQLLTAQKKG